eukprot:gb/GFBE01076522.1/.p1 GENE.gb/GFBE01076522.1/~~gb/GFBE01076522.1/.p1  ORF type:complete len:623 (+),score=98.27 gb/GFBE01076522.1/:1-1869(+)
MRQQASTKKQLALQSAAEIVEVILQEGGRILHAKRHHEMVIHNTWEVAYETTCSHLDMHFVPHSGNPIDEDDNEAWIEDDEPRPVPPDIWARNYIEVKKDRPPSAESQPASRTGSKRRTRSKTRLGTLTLQKEEAALDATNKPASVNSRRAFPLQERRHNPDALLEESFRKLWSERAAARALWEEAEAQAECEAANQEAKQRKKVLEQLGDAPQTTIEGRQPYTFNSDGRITFLDRSSASLPNMAERLQFDVNTMTRSHSALVLEEALSSSSSATAGSKDAEAPFGQAPRQVRLPPAEAAERPQWKSPRHVFTDGFEKLEHAQPSLMDTMQLQKGVVLACHGVTKSGPKADGESNRMPWKDYVAKQGWEPKKSGPPHLDMIDEDDLFTSAGVGTVANVGLNTPSSLRSAAAGSVRPTPSAAGAGGQSKYTGEPESSAHPTVGGNSQPPTPSAASIATTTRAAAAAAATAAAMCANHWPPGVKAPPVRPVSAKSGPPSPTAPAEPAPGVLASRSVAGAIASFTVLRSQPRLPRQKAVLIGGHGGAGAPIPPPIGATMGHGLLPSEDQSLRAAARKGEFYYPSKSAQRSEKPMLRASSTGSIRRPRSASTIEGHRAGTPARAWR